MSNYLIKVKESQTLQYNIIPIKKGCQAIMTIFFKLFKNYTPKPSNSPHTFLINIVAKLNP